jgi:hypothetical protein
MSRTLAMMELILWDLKRNVVEWEARDCAETSKIVNVAAGGKAMLKNSRLDCLSDVMGDAPPMMRNHSADLIRSDNRCSFWLIGFELLKMFPPKIEQSMTLLIATCYLHTKSK